MAINDAVEEKCPKCGKDMANFLKFPENESLHVCFECKRAFVIQELIRQKEM